MLYASLLPTNEVSLLSLSTLISSALLLLFVRLCFVRGKLPFVFFHPPPNNFFLDSVSFNKIFG